MLEDAEIGHIPPWWDEAYLNKYIVDNPDMEVLPAHYTWHDTGPYDRTDVIFMHISSKNAEQARA
jgi:hypothetical protein